MPQDPVAYARRDRRDEILTAGSVLLPWTLGLYLPLSVFPTPSVDRALELCWLRSETKIGPLLLLSIPCVILVINSRREPLGEQRGLCAEFFDMSIFELGHTTMIVQSLLAPVLGFMTNVGYAACSAGRIRSTWWIFSIAPVTNVPVESDQLFALACGIFVLFRCLIGLLRISSISLPVIRPGI